MLELKGVYAGYGGGDVLRDISCSFPRGSLWCVLGPNCNIVKRVLVMCQPRLYP